MNMEQEMINMRFEIIEHESAYDTIKDTVTGEEYTVVDTNSKKLLNLLNDYEYGKREKTGTKKSIEDEQEDES